MTALASKIKSYEDRLNIVNFRPLSFYCFDFLIKYIEKEEADAAAAT